MERDIAVRSWVVAGLGGPDRKTASANEDQRLDLVGLSKQHLRRITHGIA